MNGLPAPPEVLIFFRIPKTGGNTMDRPLARCFPGAQHFDAEVGFTGSALLTRSREKIEAKFRSLPLAQQQAVRCVMGTHIPLGLHTLFDRPAKYFTIVRHPVDRVVSSFFHLRRSTHIPSYPHIKDMTLENYLDSGIGLDPFDQQVRMLSGCPELDVPMDAAGRPISAPKVERRHLEMAKRNIEALFVAAAPLEDFTGMLLFLRAIYGWKMHNLVFRVRNETPGRPRLAAVAEATRRRLADCNRYDIELYDWVQARFAAQIARLEPAFTRERARFALLNGLAQGIGRFASLPARKLAGRLLAVRRAASA
jgi:hypothetical protein